MNKRKGINDRNVKNIRMCSNRNNAEMIDRILLKNALSNLKIENVQPAINTSIE
jgi:hypothetical protein